MLKILNEKYVHISSLLRGSKFKFDDNDPEIYELVDFKRNGKFYKLTYKDKKGYEFTENVDNKEQVIFISNPLIKIKKYVIYKEGTWNNYRAQFYKHKGKPMYSNEADADIFTETEVNKICPGHGTYKWIPKQV